jgi:hypothetical protein
MQMDRLFFHATATWMATLFQDNSHTRLHLS